MSFIDAHALALIDARNQDVASAVGPLNAQIASLQSQAAADAAQIVSLQGQIATLQQEVADKTQEIGVLMVQHDSDLLQIAALQGSVAGLQSQIVALQAQVAALQGQLASLTTPITTGGAGKPVIVVSAKTDAALRSALNGDDRFVIVPPGDYTLFSPLTVGNRVTVLGPGAILHGYGFQVWGKSDVIIRGFRLQDFTAAGQDGVQIKNDCHRVWVDQCDIEKTTDGAIDVTSQSTSVWCSDILITRCVFRNTINALLVMRAKARVEGCVFLNNQNRNPQVGDTGGVGGFIHFEKNLVVANGQPTQPGGTPNAYGLVLRAAGKANLIDNYYINIGTSNVPGSVFNLEVGAQLYAKGNVSGSGFDLDGMSTVSAPLVP